MGQVQLMNLSHKHYEILNYMVANPTARIKDVAALYDITPSYLSMLVHCDLFQEELRKKQDAAFHPVQMSVKERLTALANTSVERLLEKVEEDENISSTTLLEIAGSALDRLGYGTGKGQGGGVTINMPSIPADTLAEARAAFGQVVKRVPDSEEEESLNAPAINIPSP